MMEGIEKEGIVLILDNTLLAPKEDMLMNAPMYDQYKKKKKWVIPYWWLKTIGWGEPIYDQYMKEEGEDAHIEEEEIYH